MARQRFNKYQRRENYKKELAKNMHGEGTYIFENASDKADLTLPRPTKSGVRRVGPKGRFQGDSYYFGLVRSNELRLIETIQTPEAEREANMQQKLILDQPDIVKETGRVEHVLPVKKKTPLHEGDGAKEPEPEVLLTEDPMSGVEIIME